MCYFCLAKKLHSLNLLERSEYHNDAISASNVTLILKIFQWLIPISAIAIDYFLRGAKKEKISGGYMTASSFSFHFLESRLSRLARVELALLSIFMNKSNLQFKSIMEKKNWIQQFY